MLEGLGYNVLMYDFKPMKAAISIQRDKDVKEHGDALYTIKTKWPKADIAIWNLLNRPVIELINTDLLKEFQSPENPERYHKILMFTANLRRSLGSGIVFS